MLVPRFIDNDEFDEQLSRTLAAATVGCADLGEALSTAERIIAGDMNSWFIEWTRTAARLRAEGDRSQADGHRLGAASCYLRAAEYYRQGFFFARDDLDASRLHRIHAAHRRAFRAALPLLYSLGEEVSIPYQHTTLHGYLLRPEPDHHARATIIAPAGYDSTAEAGYASTGVGALRHGYNCLIFEGPGQGGVLYEQRLCFRPDFEAVLTPVVNWLVTQPGVDADRLVLFGRSFAGYLAARGASAEHRIAALVCDPAQYDFAASVRARFGDAVWRQLQDDDPALDGALAPLLDDPIQRNGLVSRMVTHGTSTVREYLRELCRFSLVGRSERISCPTLALEAEGDFASAGQLKPFVESLTCPVTAHRFSAAEGAGGHCESLGQRRLERVVYEWLDTVLPRDPGSGPAATGASITGHPARGAQTARVQGIDNVGICVTDLARSTAFYQRLGAEKIGENDRGVTMAAGTTKLFLFSSGRTTPVPQRTLGLFSNPPGIDHLSFQADDVDALHRELTARRIPTDGAPADQGWGARLFGLCDPDGNNLYVLSWR